MKRKPVFMRFSAKESTMSWPFCPIKQSTMSRSILVHDVVAPDEYLLEEERMRFLIALLKEAEMMEVSEEITDCRDVKDNKFLELAVGGKANCIVSGDDDLLVLNPFRGIPILTSREFLSSLPREENLTTGSS